MNEIWIATEHGQDSCNSWNSWIESNRKQHNFNNYVDKVMVIMTISKMVRTTLVMMAILKNYYIK